MKQRMTLWQERLFPDVPPTEPGIYSFHPEQPEDLALPIRLRVDPGGYGVLTIASKRFFLLPPLATDIMLAWGKAGSPETAIQALAAHYSLPLGEMRALVDELLGELQGQMARKTAPAAINLAGEPPSQQPLSPYQLQCALTYHILAEHAQDIAPQQRVRRELVTREWAYILETASAAGIPHILLTGGEPTLRPDLPELVNKVGDLGMVCTLATDGLRLTERDYWHQLLAAGLLHVILLFDPAEEQSWEALRDILVERVHVTVHLDVASRRSPQARAIFARLRSMGVDELALSAARPEDLQDLPAWASELQAEGFSMAPDFPLPFSNRHPANASDKLSARALAGAGRCWLYVEPDGDVLPDQAIQKDLGNLLNEPWESIWARAQAFGKPNV